MSEYPTHDPLFVKADATGTADRTPAMAPRRLPRIEAMVQWINQRTRGDNAAWNDGLLHLDGALADAEADERRRFVEEELGPLLAKALRATHYQLVTTPKRGTWRYEPSDTGAASLAAAIRELL